MSPLSKTKGPKGTDVVFLPEHENIITIFSDKTYMQGLYLKLCD